jgi:hypothetical protein
MLELSGLGLSPRELKEALEMYNFPRVKVYVSPAFSVASLPKVRGVSFEMVEKAPTYCAHLRDVQKPVVALESFTVASPATDTEMLVDSFPAPPKKSKKKKLKEILDELEDDTDSAADESTYEEHDDLVSEV